MDLLYLLLIAVVHPLIVLGVILRRTDFGKPEKPSPLHVWLPFVCSCVLWVIQLIFCVLAAAEHETLRLVVCFMTVELSQWSEVSLKTAQYVTL